MAENQIQPVNEIELHRCERAAATAAAQLDLAIDLVNSRFRGVEGDARTAAVVGVLQAIASNYAILAT